MDWIDSTRGALAPRLPLAAVALALALATPAAAAAAAQKATAPARTPGAATSAPSPASVPSARPATLVAPEASRARPAPSVRTAWVGGAVGAISAFDVGKSVALQLDYGVLRTPPSWRRFDLEWHLVVAFARPTGETPLSATVIPPFGFTPVQVSAGQEQVTALLFEVVPTARFLWTVTQGVAFFADAGLGLCQTFESYDRSEMFNGRSTRSEYATGVVARIGAGLAADVAPRWRVVFEPLALELQLGPKFSAFTPTLGVAYRL